MKSSFMDYAMSVIVSRALPDVRDGLEAGPPPHPLHAAPDQQRLEPRLHQVRARRRRRARQVSTRTATRAAYDALVRMAQDFAMRYPLDRRPGQLRLDRRRSAGRLPLHRVPHGAASAASCWPTSTRRPSTSSRTTTTRSSSRRSCRRASRTCSSTAPPASPSAWRPTSRRTTWARSSTARSRSPRTPTSPSTS